MAQLVIGLGSNIGKRRLNLEKAIQALPCEGIYPKRRASLYENPALVPDHALPQDKQPYLNTVVEAETKHSAQDCLAALKRIEQALGRAVQAPRFAARVIDLDILCFNRDYLKDTHLQIPHPRLSERWFTLLPLSELYPNWVYPEQSESKEAGLSISRLKTQLKKSSPVSITRVFAPYTQLVGILNVTPDSFSDGGRFFETEQALRQALHLVDSGASVIDIGAQSTRPQAVQGSAEQEWARLKPVLHLLSNHPKRAEFEISIDTYHLTVAEQAIEQYHVDWINDVSGDPKQKLMPLLKASGKRGVFMHALTIPADPNKTLPEDASVEDILFKWMEAVYQKGIEAGLAPQQIILDPGLCFGKSLEQNKALLKAIPRLSKLPAQLLIGHSRKSFLSPFQNLAPAEREPEGLAVSAYLQAAKVSYLRVHDPDLHHRHLAMHYALTGPF